MPFGGLLTVGLIGAGTSLFGGIMGSSAAGKAAAAQSQAAQKGINLAGSNLQAATGLQGQLLSNIGQQYAPYQAAGAGGINALSAYLQPGGQLAQPWTQQFTSPTAAEAAAYPAFQFQMQQGQNAIQSSAAARGSLLTGGTMKALMNYGQGLASTTYQQTYNNALQNYLQNYNQFQNNQTNLFNRLYQTTGLGAQMQGQFGGLQQAAAQNYANMFGQNTSAMAQLLGAQGAAQASGTVGAANAWTGAANNMGNLATTFGLGSAMGLFPGVGVGKTPSFTPEGYTPIPGEVQGYG